MTERLASDTTPVTDLGQLRQRVGGTILGPDDPAYEQARTVHNASVDRRPAAIIRCADADDVRAAVLFAGTHDVPLSVRAGGHNVNGFAVNDGGLVIDLTAMRSVEVDAARRVARVAGGATWADVDGATSKVGLATPGAIVSSVGVTGLVLGGGLGHLNRPHGLACDHLVGAEAVTADGDLIRVGEDQHPDLLWALRGGGGNFGAVTALELRLEPIGPPDAAGTVLAGPIFYPAAAAREALAAYRDHLADAPDELGAFFGFHLAPPLPFIPDDLHGTPMCVIVVCWTGDHDAGHDVVAPLLDSDVGPPVASGVDAVPYPALQSSFDDLAPPGLHQHWRGEFVTALTDDVIDVHATYGPSVPTIPSLVHLYPLDGATGRVPTDATAFAYRDADHSVLIAAQDPEAHNLSEHAAWVDEYWAALRAHSAGGAYVNFMMQEGPDRVAAAFRDNYDRLTQVKRRYDPANLFRQNQNVPPA